LIALMVSFLMVASSFGNPGERTFEATFSDLLRVFEGDLATRELPIRNEVSFRKVEVAGKLPPSFKAHLRSRVTEVLLRSHTLISANPQPNRQVRLLDVLLYFDEQKLVLSISIQDLETKTLMRQLNYDSEELKAGTKDFSFGKKDSGPSVEKWMQYPSTLLYGLRVSYVSLPDLSERSSLKEIGVRVLERFSNRRYELGFDLSSALGGDSTKDSVYQGVSVQGVFMVGRSFFGKFEDYDRLRIVGYLGLGGYYTDGLLGAILRTGVDFRIGKSFAIHSTVGYRPATSALISEGSKSLRGIEFGVGLVAQFEGYGRL
jgi:hypothetical protein